MKLLIASVAALSFTIGGITGQASRPVEAAERERADRLQKSYWKALGAIDKLSDELPVQK
jgi:hypothetical protein